ncbi:OsmC family protein [Desulfotomaculum nigrificans CO-1-SRB]|uniref:OsmC family protein n=1 Tax=Desulfotomaculum nigrificans (strain DSM 14880 / VKM B-2319 / CO-1-SRB) TaxID=868595 RepID=F6B530_DESCC|nr:OsmC family protein [Desulfotomaculum nigrificans]AEF93049.1 OsmC family protein [Desulfotomaculum nigrificans CO-1-SRB]
MSKVQVSWEGNMKFVGTDETGFKIPMDAAAIYGGQNQGVRPMELMLMSLGGCTGIEVGHILNKMRVKFDSLNIEVTGERVNDHPKVFSTIHVIYRFTGENIPVEKVMKALQLAEQVYCSAANMLNKVAKITYAVDINGTTYEYAPKLAS